MVLYCDGLVLVYMELDFGELVCNQLVLSCREQNALNGGLDEALGDGHGGVLDGVLDAGLQNSKHRSLKSYVM